MCPDNDTPNVPLMKVESTQGTDAGSVGGIQLTNPTLAEDDKFRRTIEPSVGPNVDGPMNQIRATHPPRDDEGKPIAREDEPSASMEPATTKHTPVRDIEPSMPAPDAPHVPDVPLEG